MVQATIFRSPWGWIGIAESGRGVSAISLPQPSRRSAERKLRETAGPFTVTMLTPGLRKARTELLRYLAGGRRSFSVSVDVAQGTEFQRRVWRVLQHMPYGSFRSYQWVADRVGGSRYARAVGNAVGANPVPIIIPCHRVVASDASLGGFSGGLPMKRRLLTLEGTLSSLRNGRPSNGRDKRASPDR